MKSKWSEREWWLALLTPVLVGLLTQAGLSEKLVLGSIVPLVTWIVMRKYEKAKNGKGGK